jgi:hypothetical protein
MKTYHHEFRDTQDFFPLSLSSDQDQISAVDVLRGWHLDLRRACAAWRSRDSTQLDNIATEQLAYELCRLVKLQCICKSSLFFPVLRPLIAVADMVRQAETENNALAAAVKKIHAMDARDSRFASTVDVLCDNVGLHCRKLESRLFPLLERWASDINKVAQALAEQHQLLSEDDEPVGRPVESLN